VEVGKMMENLVLRDKQLGTSVAEGLQASSGTEQARTHRVEAMLAKLRAAKQKAMLSPDVPSPASSESRSADSFRGKKKSELTGKKEEALAAANKAILAVQGASDSTVMDLIRDLMTTVTSLTSRVASQGSELAELRGENQELIQRVMRLERQQIPVSVAPVATPVIMPAKTQEAPAKAEKPKKKIYY
jgi:hypothetical protein